MDLGISNLPPLDNPFQIDLESSDGSFDSLEFLMPQSVRRGSLSSPLSSLPTSPIGSDRIMDDSFMPAKRMGFESAFVAPTTVNPPISIKVENAVPSEFIERPIAQQQPVVLNIENSTQPATSGRKPRIASKNAAKVAQQQQQQANIVADKTGNKKKRTRSTLEKESAPLNSVVVENNPTIVVKEPSSVTINNEPNVVPSSVINQASLPMSRDDLRKLSSKNFEQMASNLSSSQAILTEDEERQLKRQKRLIKNRESAQLSRQRKKQYMEELEKKVESLNATNDMLSEQVTSLSSDKQKLEEEVLFLRNLVKQSPTMSQAEKKQALTSRNAKAAGICLLIMLFSFGLVSEKLNVSLKKDAKATAEYSREEIPEVLPNQAKISSPKFGRALLEASPEQISNSQLIPDLSMPSAEKHQALLMRKGKIRDQQNPVYVFCQNPETVVGSRDQLQASTKDISFLFPIQNLDLPVVSQLPVDKNSIVEFKCNVASVGVFKNATSKS